MSRIIVALDRMSRGTAEETIYFLKDHIWGIKINDLLLECGIDIIKSFRYTTNIMADPKLYDIPNTICNSVVKLVDAGAKIITVHASAEYNTDDDKSKYREYLAGITVLTSMSESWQKLIYNTNRPLIVKLAEVIVNRGWKYLVCSANDLITLNRYSWFSESNVKVICPSIALSNQKIKNDDQRKRFTPAEAIKNGADLLVVGRAILTQTTDPLDILKQINEEVEQELNNISKLAEKK